MIKSRMFTKASNTESLDYQAMEPIYIKQLFTSKVLQLKVTPEDQACTNSVSTNTCHNAIRGFKFEGIGCLAQAVAEAQSKLSNHTT